MALLRGSPSQPIELDGSGWPETPQRLSGLGFIWQLENGVVPAVGGGHEPPDVFDGDLHCCGQWSGDCGHWKDTTAANSHQRLHHLPGLC